MKTTLALFASRAAIVVSFVSAAVLTGWMFDVEALKTIFGPITMKTNPVIAFIFAAGPGLVSCAAARCRSSADIPVAHEKGPAVAMEFDPAVGDVYVTRSASNRSS